MRLLPPPSPDAPTAVPRCAGSSASSPPGCRPTRAGPPSAPSSWSQSTRSSPGTRVAWLASTPRCAPPDAVCTTPLRSHALPSACLRLRRWATSSPTRRSGTARRCWKPRPSSSATGCAARRRLSWWSCRDTTCSPCATCSAGRSASPRGSTSRESVMWLRSPGPHSPLRRAPWATSRPHSAAPACAGSCCSSARARRCRSRR